MAEAIAYETAQDRLGETLPQRVLGRTGQLVTLLGVGGAHVGMAESDQDAQAIIETALEGGVRFFDTAQAYQEGRSEARFGKFLTPKYRDVVFLMTKSIGKDAKTVRQHLEDSLRRLDTDYLDLWQMHAVGDPEDVDARIDAGVLDVFEEAKASGKVRHIGFTGHKSPYAHCRVLERTDIFETCQMPINCADPSYESFILNVLPTLVERNIGVLAMKTLSNGGFFGAESHFKPGNNPLLVPDRVSIVEALSFVWSLPVDVIITGADNAGQMREKIDIAKSFEPMEEDVRQALIERVADRAGTLVEFYKA